MANDTKAFPTQTDRDPALETNQLRPTSLRTNGCELDPCCGGSGEIPQASAGTGLDKAMRLIDGKGKR